MHDTEVAEFWSCWCGRFIAHEPPCNRCASRLPQQEKNKMGWIYWAALIVAAGMVIFSLIMANQK